MELFKTEIQKKMINDRLDAGENDLPTIFLKCSDGVDMMLALPFENDDQKLMTVMALRKVFLKLGVISYAFVMEAWLTKDVGGIKPSQADDRVEVAIFLLNDKKVEKNVLWPITREAGGKAFVTDNWDLGATGSGGLFSNLFDIKPYHDLSPTRKRAIDKMAKQLIKAKNQNKPTYH